MLALGSNVGNREYLLRSAIDRLLSLVRIVRVSRFRETDAVDSPPWAGPYLNAVITGVTSVGPRELLAATQRIERQLGRRVKGGNLPRTVDIDIIFYGTLRMRTTVFTVPHPRWRGRDFVMRPLREIDWVSAARV